VSKPSILFASCLSLLLSVLAGCANNGDGGCPTPCASAEACCDGMCVFTQISQQHCGGCNMPCAGTCSNGMCLTGPGVDGGPGHDAGPIGACRPTCASSQRCCGTTCTNREQPVGVDGRPASADDPSSTFNNCNGCGLRCDPERAISCSVRTGGTVPECTCGNIGLCTPGSICAMTTGGYQCINTMTHPEHCGAIGNACGVGETCTGGVCGCGSAGPCPTGQGCCAGACVDVTSDATNCGACGTVCGENAPTCQAGVCVCGSGAGARACAAPMAAGSGFPPTPAMLGESCCDNACVANTDTNCGCGVACDPAEDESCVVSGGGFPIPGGPTGGTGVCCGEEIPILGALCSGGGGFPGLGDGGIPGFP